MYTLYVHVTPNNKYYVGITKTAPNIRWGNKGNKYKKQVFYNAVQKYGWENIKHIIVLENLNYKKAVSLEKKYILKLKSNNPIYGYNITSGGEGTSGALISDETRKKLIEKSLGKNNPFYNKKHSDKTKEIISIKNTGKFLGSKSVRAKKVYCFENNKVYDCITTASKELNINRVQISNVCNGKSISAGGYTFTYFGEKPQLKQRTDSRWKPVICLETKKFYMSITEASNKTNISMKCISDCCKGRQKTAGGFHWEFKED